MSSKHSNDDDDSFSIVGLSDAESLSLDANDPGSLSSENKNKIHSAAPSFFSKRLVVQFPPDFTTGVDNSKAAASASEASSFIPVTSFGSLKVGSNAQTIKPLLPKPNPQHQDSDNVKKSVLEGSSFLMQERSDISIAASDWSVVSSVQGNKRLADDNEAATITTFNPKNDDDSLAGGSVISGFGLISINGCSRKQCKRCSFLNERDVFVCKGCSIALVANPNMTADQKLAEQLQRQEEQDAFKDVVWHERKRDSLDKQPILCRAQVLTNDILSVVEGCRLTTPFEATVQPECSGFCGLPQANLTILASRFIDCVDEMVQTKSCSIPVKLCYYFTSKEEWRLRQIRQDGIGPNAEFGSTPKIAMDCCPFVAKHGPTFTADRSTSTRVAKGFADKEGLARRAGLQRIQEVDDVPTIQGWIVAILDGDNASLKCTSVPAESGRAWVYTRKASVQSLPLVSFDASMMHDDIIRRLLNSLTMTCHDFFGDGYDGPKRRKVESDSGSDKKSHNVCGDESVFGNGGKTDDEAIALSLQASLYDNDVVTSAPLNDNPFLAGPGEAEFDLMIDSVLGRGGKPYPKTQASLNIRPIAEVVSECTARYEQQVALDSAAVESLVDKALTAWDGGGCLPEPIPSTEVVSECVVGDDKESTSDAANHWLIQR